MNKVITLCIPNTNTHSFFRLTNVAPFHPKLHPLGGGDGGPGTTGGMGHAHAQSSPAGPRLYPHATYHGPSQHHRTPLPGVGGGGGVGGGNNGGNGMTTADLKPLRFTDSPQHGLGGGLRHR